MTDWKKINDYKRTILDTCINVVCTDEVLDKIIAELHLYGINETRTEIKELFECALEEQLLY